MLPLLPEYRINAPFGRAVSEFLAASTVYKDAPLNFVRDALLGEAEIAVPTDYKGAGDRTIRFIPGCTISGTVGPLKKRRVMIVCTIPNDTLSGMTSYAQTANNQLNMSDITLGGNLDILVQALLDCGIKAEDYYDFYVTSMIKFPALRRHLKTRPKEWIKESLPFLRQELGLVKPDYILCLGSEATTYFTGKTSVSKAQSHVFEYNDADLGVSAKVVATISPGMVSMNAEHRPEFVSGVYQLSTLLHGVAASPVQQERLYIENADDLKALTNNLISRNVRDIAVDTEWGGGTHYMDLGCAARTVQFAWSRHSAAVLVLRKQFMVPNFAPYISSAIPPLQQLLCRPEARVIAHNTQADFHALYEFGVDITPNVYFDTMLASHIFEPTTSHSLKDLSAIHIPGWKRHDLALEEWLDANKRLANVKGSAYGNIPDDLLLPYAGDDACATFALAEYYAKLLAQNPSLSSLFYETVMPAVMPLINIEQVGIYLDQDRTEDMVERYKAVQEFLLRRFRENIGDPEFNPNSPDQKADLLFNRCGLTPVKSTDDRQWYEIPDHEKKYANPSTDDESLGILSDESDVAEELQRLCVVGTLAKSSLRKLERNKDTGDFEYQKGFMHFVKPDGRLHCTISQMLKTGRLAAKEPNLMNLVGRKEEMLQNAAALYEKGSGAGAMPGIRSCFCAPPGRLLIIADYKQAEICALAYLSGDLELIRAVENQDDIHSVVGRRMFRKMDLTNDEFKNKFKALRISAKSIIFGLLYGRGAKAIAREVQKAGISCTEDEAQKLMDDFMDQYPSIRLLIERTHMEVEHQHYVETLWGRREYFPTIGKVRNNILARMKRQAFNFKIQGYVGDLLRVALHNHWKFRRANPHIDYLPVMTVHDSIVHEFDPRWVQLGVEEIVPNAMVNNSKAPRLGFTVPIDIDVYHRWDEKLYLEDFADYGLSEEFGSEFCKRNKDGTVAVRKKSTVA